DDPIDGARTSKSSSRERRFSICLPPRLYHRFWAEKAFVLGWEISMVNDDQHDNYFLEPGGRFPAIEEDEPVKWLLCGEYGILR
ncbi:D-lyxose/D-mannose family sugar isomerase, partial [Pseudomonas aeruginosa]|uniref:D-lyxose/D-mannose family sugar isomerase n=1 Tax=Pseudomonas aeruginosa TaxID=287 RepID=UPI0031B712BF